jgi:hypothetical protein
MMKLIAVSIKETHWQRCIRKLILLGIVSYIESNTAVLNQNVQTLGLVQVNSLLKATKVPGDGVNFATFDNGFLEKSCSNAIGSANYGVTYSGTPGQYQIGYNGSTKTPSGYQFW